jgi:hypothetical protein
MSASTGRTGTALMHNDDLAPCDPAHGFDVWRRTSGDLARSVNASRIPLAEASLFRLKWTLSGVRFDNRGAIDVPDRIREYGLDLVRFRARMMAIEPVSREYPWSATELLKNATVE